jgi:3-methyladenine DNA glycosylase/8-oxoguanine DNA glycosylase
VRVAQPHRDRVVFGARAETEAAAREGIDRMRFALGVDDDLRPFHERYRWDPRIGRALRRAPWLRVLRRPEPFEALAWAICEQLIDSPRAAAIQRRIVFSFGRQCPETGLRDVPSAEALARAAPARLEACGLAGGRSITMVRAAREVARGRVDLSDSDHERGWQRLRAIPGIGPWTVEMLALHGQGRYDQVPAGDLNLLKLVGRWRTGNPHARAQEDEVREVFAPYGEYAGLAATYGMRFGLA